MISGSSEMRQVSCYILLCDIVVLVTVSYDCRIFKGETGMAVRFLMDFFFGVIKFSIPERINFMMRVAILVAVCWKKAERIASTMYDLKLSKSAFV